MLLVIWLYGYMVTEDHSDSERENLMPSLHGILFPISSKGSFICTIPDRTVYTMTFVTSVVEHWRLLHQLWSTGFVTPVEEHWPLLNQLYSTGFVTPVVDHWSLLHQLWSTGLCYTSGGPQSFVTPVVDHWSLLHQLWSTGWNNKQVLVKLAVGREGRGGGMKVTNLFVVEAHR